MLAEEQFIMTVIEKDSMLFQNRSSVKLYRLWLRDWFMDRTTEDFLHPMNFMFGLLAGQIIRMTEFRREVLKKIKYKKSIISCSFHHVYMSKITLGY